jgi:hypothetical protein
MKIIYILPFILVLSSCGRTPISVYTENQFAIIQYNNLGGNKIIIPNMDQIKFYNLYRFRETDSAFAFVKKLKRPSVPKPGNFSPYIIEWTDYKVTALVPYKIEGLKDTGEKWFDVEIRYMNLKK